MNKFIFIYILSGLVLFCFTSKAQDNLPNSEVVSVQQVDQSDVFDKDGHRNGKFIIDSTYNYLGNTFGQAWFHYQRYTVSDRDQWGNFLEATTFEYDTINNIWFQHQKYQATYHDSVNASLWEAEVWDSKADKWRQSDSLAYNNSGKPVINWYKVWDPVKFRFWRGQRITYTYNAEMLANRDVQKFDTLSGNWKFDETVSYAYTEDGLLETELSMEWDTASNTWENHSNVQYLYDENNLIQSEITQFWSEANQWENNLKFEYEYFEENNKLKQRTRFLWVANTSWDVVTRTVYSYDDNLRLIEARSQVWDDFENKWYNTAVYSYVYNAQGQRTEVLFRSWDFSGYWVNESQTLYTFDDYGNQVQYVFRIWDDGIGNWANYYKYFNYWSEFVPFGINEISDLKIQIFPNPASDIIYVSFQDISINALASIYSIDGKLIFQANLGDREGQINVAGLPHGKYILVIDLDGKIHSQVVVKN